MDGPSVSQAPLRVAVAGAGAFGKNHLRVYRELEAAGLGVALVAAVEPDPARAAETAERYAIPVFATADELLAADLQARRGDRRRPHRASPRGRLGAA